MHHGIATAIASDFSNRKEFPQRQATLAIFSSQNASQPRPYRYRREIATYLPERIAAYSWWPRKRIADFDRKSSPGDVALSPWSTLWPRGSTGVQRYGCILRSAANNLGEISSKSLLLKSLSGEGTLWDSSLPASLTLWDTPALFTPPLPLPQTLWVPRLETLGKSKGGLTKGGLSPKFSEKIGGKSFLRNRAFFWGKLGPFQGLSGPFRGRSGPIPPHPTATGEERKLPRKGPFWPNFGRTPKGAYGNTAF